MKQNPQFTIETQDGKLDDDNFRTFRSLIRCLSNDQCRVAMRQLILGQNEGDADMAMLARIGDYLAFGERYGKIEDRHESLEQFKKTLTVENIRDAWDKCGF